MIWCTFPLIVNRNQFPVDLKCNSDRWMQQTEERMPKNALPIEIQLKQNVRKRKPRRSEVQKDTEFTFPSFHSLFIKASVRLKKETKSFTKKTNLIYGVFLSKKSLYGPFSKPWQGLSVPIMPTSTYTIHITQEAQTLKPLQVGCGSRFKFEVWEKERKRDILLAFLLPTFQQFGTFTTYYWNTQMQNCMGKIKVRCCNSLLSFYLTRKDEEVASDSWNCFVLLIGDGY